MTTQRAFASYQEIVDLHTEDSTVSILGFHTPSDDKPYVMLRGFFDTFRQFKYNGMSLSLVPAARLPADPSQVSADAGDQIPIDPRDLLNPILFHGCHGDDMGAILNQFYAGTGITSTDFTRRFTDSVDHNQKSITQVGDQPIYESLYYRALTDNTWLKAHPQRGFRKRLHPRVYDIASNFQILPSVTGQRAPVTTGFGFADMGVSEGSNGAIANGNMGAGTTTNDNFVVSRSQSMTTTTEINNPDTSEGAPAKITVEQIAATHNGQAFFTSRTRPLGWLDTRQYMVSSTSVNSGALTGDEMGDANQIQTLFENVETVEKRTYLPKLFMGMCLLPPAYKSEQYFRLIINHSFSFRGYRGISMRADTTFYGGSAYAPTAFNLN